MSHGSRTIRIVTNDEALFASARGAVAALEGWDIAEPQSIEDLLGSNLGEGDVLLLDAWLRTENVYESCRRLTGRTRCRTFLITDERNHHADALASFCGATGVVLRPLSGDKLRALLVDDEATRSLAVDGRGGEAVEDGVLPERLLRDLAGEGSSRLIDAMIDPETGLYSYGFLNFKLDEEFKRAKRFLHPLSCVMLGFDGQADEDALGALAGIFLNASRDTDVLGRFDQSSFLFLLANTGPDGAEVMARRIRASAEEEGLRDLVGDRLAIAVGISYYPHADIVRREDLFSRCRAAFHDAQEKGGVVVSAG